MCASSWARIASSCCGDSAATRAGREQDDRLQPADHRRHVDQRRLEQRDRAADVQAAREPRRHALPLICRGPVAARAQPLDPDPSGQQPQAQHRHAGDPHEDQGRQQRLDPDRRHHARHEEAAPRSAVSRPATRASPGRSAADRGAGPRTGERGSSGQRRTRRVPSARSDWNFCTPLTTGSVSISARPTADDHVADVRGAPAQGQQHQCRQDADRGPLPHELQERPAHGLGGRLAQQGLNRGHLGPPSRSARRQSPSGCPAAPPRTRACWRAPAGRASTTIRRTPDPPGPARAAAASSLR